ncbi:unnamed protein product [marine sediment metagenome]|uniref:Uncharacterized protein n=1 Tax=marine sediment metagenome TaxID=412755 RepID=X1JH19_9ZZZZ
MMKTKRVKTYVGADSPKEAIDQIKNGIERWNPAGANVKNFKAKIHRERF